MKLYDFVIYLAYAVAALSGFFLAKGFWVLTLLLIPVWIGMIVVGNLKGD